LRICLVYDHVYPQTIGGTERWMRDLANGLVARGHSVTYLTMRHWHTTSPPTVPGVRLVGLTAPGRVYSDARRTFGPPVRFGAAVAAHLARSGRAYDVVHTAAFPYFPLLGTALARRRARYRLVVDWHEVWTRHYWRRYAGHTAGELGWLVQRACVRVPHQAFCMSRLHADRLLAEGYRQTPVILPGLYSGPVSPSPMDEVDPGLVVYAGRHVREKRVDLLVRAFARARARRPELRLELYGDGPTRPKVAALARELGVEHCVVFAGRETEGEVSSALARAACLATASEREGYGLVVVEAAARGTPSVVVAGPENAATELVLEGVNGAIAPAASVDALADALLRVVDAGPALRASTAQWFAGNATDLTLDRSLDIVLAAYDPAPGTARATPVGSR
jgi:glycosyltransferase involved in cell wall biosynthesis